MSHAGATFFLIVMLELSLALMGASRSKVQVTPATNSLEWLHVTTASTVDIDMITIHDMTLNTNIRKALH